MKHLPTILLLGDSIRIHYQPLVLQKCKGWAHVVGPEENCQFSTYTLASLSLWFERFGLPDLIHWNNGLHDVGHNPNRAPEQFPLETYVKNLDFILRQLRATKAKVIWATSTPVHEDYPIMKGAWWWKNAEIDLYNDAALKLMRSRRVPINDLHAVISSKANRCFRQDRLHLSKIGIEACADAVAAMIRKHLPGKSEREELSTSLSVKMPEKRRSKLA